jgi:hypothetical protein
LVDYDITEGIPLTLSNPAGSTTYNPTGEAYDIAVAGLPFFLAASDETPYRRVTAQYRKQQIDQTREAGEQTLTGWWLRSQSSFHQGAGIKFFEPIQDESLRFQYTESKGVDVWSRGQATLLNSTVRIVTSTNTPIVLGVRDDANNIDSLVVANGPTLSRIEMTNDSATLSNYTLTTNHGTAPFVSLTSDGSRYFAADNVTIHRGAIYGTTNDQTIYSTGTTKVVLKYAKQRLIAGIDASLYELDSNIAGSTTHATGPLPTGIYTNPNPAWTWTALAEGPAAFYAAGYAGARSSIFKITLDTSQSNTLGFPELNVPTVTADFPEGEIVQGFDTYLGTYAVICTNKGVRVGLLSADGDISYGPLLYEGNAKAVTFKDRFAYVTGMVDGDSGLIRIDLSEPLGNTLVFPYAWDVYASGETAIPTSTDFLGSTDRVAFAVPGDGVWIESYGVKVSDGYLQTGYVRYNTLENKVYKLLSTRFDTGNGGLTIRSIAPNGTEYVIGQFIKGQNVPELNIPYPVGAQEYLGFKFTITRDDADTTKGPLLTGYQIKALPAVPRQRLIQYPVFCFDHESDSLGVEIGYEGSAYDRLIQLETVENNGDTIRVEDFRTGESYLGIIEELDFINQTPSDKRFSGFGGKLLITIRSV